MDLATQERLRYENANLLGRAKGLIEMVVRLDLLVDDGSLMAARARDALALWIADYDQLTKLENEIIEAAIASMKGDA